MRYRLVSGKLVLFSGNLVAENLKTHDFPHPESSPLMGASVSNKIKLKGSWWLELKA